MADWKNITGVVVKGYRVASGLAGNSPYPRGTIEMQAPFFLERGLDLRPYYPATIGVSIEPATFAVVRPEYTFRGVKWSPEHEAEDFSFSRCRIRFEDEKREALLYYPHPETKLGHHHGDSTLEVIAPFIGGIHYGAAVELEINTDEIAIKAA